MTALHIELDLMKIIISSKLTLILFLLGQVKNLANEAQCSCQL